MKKTIEIMVATALLCQHGPTTLAKNEKDPEAGNTIENILRPPEVYNMTMSPDGQYAASVAPTGQGGDRGVLIFNLDTMQIHRSFKWKARDIDSVTWTTKDDVAFHLSKWGAFAEGVYSVNVNRDEIYTLISNDAIVHWVDPIPHSNEAWVWLRKGFQLTPSLARLRVDENAQVRRTTGGYETPATSRNPLLSDHINEPKGEVMKWWTDQNHQPRIALRFYKDQLEYLHRSNVDEGWEPLRLDPEKWDIELFGAENNTLYVAGYNDESTKGLYSYDIDTETIGELLFRDDYYDFSDSASYLLFQKQLIGFRYLRDRTHFVWLHPNLETIQGILDGSLPGRINIIYQSSEDFGRHLVYSYSDSVPPEYLVLDLEAKSLQRIAATAPWLNYSKLASTEVFHFETNDGLKLEGYLTRPVDKSNEPYPTIMLVHGGPWVRDHSGYNDETQLFAQNGYAVVRVNYRGSPGYGKKISKDHQFEFRKMQGDIAEAARFMVTQGIADPNRIAIMGASFGGYSALCGAAFESELYRCAISKMGVFDWEEMIKSLKRKDLLYAHHKLLEGLGNPKEHKERFEEISPIYHIDKIKVPIFLIHGKDDSKVSIRQSKVLRSELKKHGIEHEVLFLDGEGHALFSPKNRMKAYKQILRFLDKNME